MNKKELHALVYETKTGELRLVVVDDMGNIGFAGPVSAEYFPHMLNHLHEVESWKMPADIEDARKWWNATAATPGTELVYCRRPLWENMRNAARRAFGAVSPTPAELSAKYAGKKVIVMASPIKNKDARKARNLYFVDVTTRQGNNIVATRYELNTSVMGAAAKQAFGVND